ncbi:MAG: NACHT domain-containing protein [Caldilineaceae bacterium]|nr:NACHT domain-containing protein [Caldilineaceae bacterium]
MDLKSFGTQLQQLRKAAGLSQESLATALDQLAQAASSADYRVVDSTLISRWERAPIQKGRRWKPTRPYVLYLLQIFTDYLDSTSAQQWTQSAGYTLTPQELADLFTESSLPRVQTVDSEPMAPLAVGAGGTALPTTSDLAEMPLINQFHGRQAEVETLMHWLHSAPQPPMPQAASRDRGARVVTILGMGGMGKTALAAQVVTRLAQRGTTTYSFILWRALLNAPPLTELLQSWLAILSRQSLAALPATTTEQIALLLAYLRQERCLLILDNLESILQGEAEAGAMRPGYEAYEELLQQVASNAHQSCLLITSREQPQALEQLQRQQATIHQLALTGLDAQAGEALLQAQGLALSPQQATNLITHYSGNPLALRIVASTVSGWFAGNVEEFQRDGTPVFDDIRAVLDQHFARLSELERELLLWLAVEREAVTAMVLRNNLVQQPPQRHLLEALRTLERRSLLLQQGNGYTLQNVVLEYTTDRLIETVCTELTDAANGDSTKAAYGAAQPEGWFNRFALLKAQAKEYVRQSQHRLISQPVGERLGGRAGRAQAIRQLDQVLAQLRHNRTQQAALIPGYAAGNLINLLLQLNADLTGYDFSRLAVWQAYLQGVDLPAVTFAHADLQQCVFTKNFGLCRALSFTHDGKLLGGGMTNGEIHLWQPEDGQTVAMFKIHETRIWDIAFSPDGQWMVSGSKDQTVRVTDRHTGHVLRILHGHTDWVRTVAFHPNSQIVASGSQDQTVRLWDVQSGRTLHVLPHQGWILDLAFSPDGTYLASGGTDNMVRLWDVQTGQLIATLSHHQAAIYAVHFSPDGQFLATGSDDLTIRLWETTAIVRQASQPCRTILTGHQRGIYAMAFSPNGRALFSGGAEATIRVWEVNTGQLVNTLVGHQREVNTMTMHPQGHFLATGETDTSMIYLWDLHTTETRARASRLGYRNWANAVAFHPQEPLLAGASADGKVHLWDGATGRYLQALHGKKRMGTSLLFSHSPALAATFLAVASTDQAVHLWSIHRDETGRLNAQPKHQLPTQAEVHATEFSSDGHYLVAGSYDGALHLWDTQLGQRLQTAHIVDDPRIKDIAVQPNGPWVAVGSHQPTIALWHRHTGATRKLEGHSAWVWNVSFHPNGQILASGSHDRTVRLWDIERGVLYQLLPHQSSLVYALVFNQDGRWLAVGTGDATIYLWDTSELTINPTTPPRLVHTLQGHFDVIQDLAFSSDGWLASASLDGTIKVWETQTGHCRHTLRAPGPYAGMDITGVTGITPMQQAAIQALGAVSMPL